MASLFDDDADIDVELKTDTDYAKNYNTWRKKEELHKLQARYGEINSSSDSSSEDDDCEQPDVNFDRNFFKTLSLLKTKDRRIYDKKSDFFENTEKAETSKINKKAKKEQPMYLKDYERKIVLEKGGQLSDEDDEEKDMISKPFTYTNEQNELKENLKKALDDINDEDGDDDENWGGLFKTRERTSQETEKEEDDYVQWLAGQSENLQDEEVESALKPLKQYWSDPKLGAGEKFLRDYILNKRFLESESADYVPTYDEIVHDSDKDLSEDEKVINEQEEFEHKYNFRFEEPDQEFLKRYPRTLENSLRQKDDKRKVKRLERKERKIDEKRQKMEEINKFKELKKQEIQEKIDKLKEVTGNTDIAFDVNDFEGDFDPDEHDKRMHNLFNDEFYEGPEGEQKPEFPDLDEELELENWDRWHGDDDENSDNHNKDDSQQHCEDENFIMDCDYDPAATQQELINNSKRKKKRRRKSKFAKVLSEPKPVFDPEDRTYQEYLDEYYKLDCEDVIGDVPCRFKYRQVIPNDFGLSVEEILAAKDKELNRWCSLKKALQYRPEHVEKYDVIAFKKKASNTELKKKYIPSLFQLESDDTNTTTSGGNNTTESLSKKKRKRENKIDNDVIENVTSVEEVSTIQTSHVDVSESTTNVKNNKEISNPDTSLDNSELQNQLVNKIKSKSNINDTNRKKKKNKEIKIASPDINDSSSTKIDVKNSKKRKHSSLSEDVIKVKKHKQMSFNNVKSKPKKSEKDIGISDARLAAYGFKPKKFKNKLKYGNPK